MKLDMYLCVEVRSKFTGKPMIYDLSFHGCELWWTCLISLAQIAIVGSRKADKVHYRNLRCLGHCLRNEIRHVFVRRSQIKVHFDGKPMIYDLSFHGCELWWTCLISLAQIAIVGSRKADKVHYRNLRCLGHCLRNEIRHVFVRRSQIKVHRKAYDIRLKFSWMWTLMNMSNFIGANCDCRQSQSGQSTLSQFALFRALPKKWN